MSIIREIEVTRKGLARPIDVTYGTNMLQIEFVVTDFILPEGATSRAFAMDGNKNVKSQPCTVSGNKISFEPKVGLFEEGKNILQLAVSYNGKNLFTFYQPVTCHYTMQFEGAKELENDPTFAGMVMQMQQELAEISEQIVNLQISGLTTEQVNALNEMFKKCVFTGDVSTEYEAFKKAFGITIDDEPNEEPKEVTYSIYRNLIGCTSSSNVTSVVEKTAHSETFTASNGFTLDGATINILMGDTDITSKCVDGTLMIESVTGDITIHISAVETVEDVFDPGLIDLTTQTVVDYNGASHTILNKHSISVEGGGYSYILVNGLKPNGKYAFSVTRNNEFVGTSAKLPLSLYGNKNENAIDDSGYGKLICSKEAIAQNQILEFTLPDNEYGIVIYVYTTANYQITNLKLVEITE